MNSLFKQNEILSKEVLFRPQIQKLICWKYIVAWQVNQVEEVPVPEFDLDGQTECVSSCFTNKCLQSGECHLLN